MRQCRPNDEKKSQRAREAGLNSVEHIVLHGHETLFRTGYYARKGGGGAQIQDARRVTAGFQAVKQLKYEFDGKILG